MRRLFQFIFMLPAFLPGFAHGTIQLLSRDAAVRSPRVVQLENVTNGFDCSKSLFVEQI